MKIYKYSMRFRVPGFDQSDCSIYDLNVATSWTSIDLLEVKLQFYSCMPYPLTTLPVTGTMLE